jgi:hypothetical protein
MHQEQHRKRLVGRAPQIAGPFAIQHELHAALIGHIALAPNIAAGPSFGLGRYEAGPKSRAESGAEYGAET